MENYENDKAKVNDISNSIDEIGALLTGFTLERFAKEYAIKDEVLFHLREIGKAASTLSEEFRETYGDVDWEVLNNLQFASWDQEMEIEPHAIWFIVKHDLPNIKDQIYGIVVVLEDKDDTFYF